mmetsp:Transcript_3152/g.6519  ORF Transcript_3152/g.6519 Transcript_3152/m.6519 type:complete len:387 (+) Transcript_3152:570-1730(+)
MQWDVQAKLKAIKAMLALAAFGCMTIIALKWSSPTDPGAWRIYGIFLMNFGGTFITEILTRSTDYQCMTYTKYSGQLVGYLVGSVRIFGHLASEPRLSSTLEGFGCLTILVYIATYFACIPYLNLSNERPISFPKLSTFFCFPLRMKLLMLAYTFIVTSGLLLQLLLPYWVSSVFYSSVPVASYLHLQRIIENGVSWASASMSALTLVTLVSLTVTDRFRKLRVISDSFILCASHLLAATCMQAVHSIRILQAAFIILPICGGALAASLLLPGDLASKLQLSHTYVCSAFTFPHTPEQCLDKPRYMGFLYEFVHFVNSSPTDHTRLHVPEKYSIDWHEWLLYSELLASLLAYGLVPWFTYDEDDQLSTLFAAEIFAIIGGVLSFVV